VPVAAERALAVPVTRTFHATADQVGEARRYLAAVMGDGVALDDAAVCLSELVTNSITHSWSRNGGFFTVQRGAHDRAVARQRR
jgi:anti-sigma regulatory factor (Ser/Thr protein kinase)